MLKKKETANVPIIVYKKVVRPRNFQPIKNTGMFKMIFVIAGSHPHKKEKSKVIPVKPPSLRLFCILKWTRPKEKIADPRRIKIIFFILKPNIIYNYLHQ